MISSQFNYETGILETIFKGDITLREILEYISFSDFDRENPGFLKILSDCREANFIVNPDDLPEIINATSEISLHHPFIIDAMVLSDPHNTALSYLYQKFSPVDKYLVRVFSGIENAIKWLEEYNVPVL